MGSFDYLPLNVSGKAFEFEWQSMVHVGTQPLINGFFPIGLRVQLGYLGDYKIINFYSTK